MSHYQTTYTVTGTDIDCFGRCRLSSLLAFSASAAGLHSNLLGVGEDALKGDALFWAIVRNRVQITRLPMEGEEVTIETWPMPVTRAAFPRSTVAYDSGGQELFRSVALWVLMHRQTRALVLPGSSHIRVEGSLTGSELSVPRNLPPAVLPEECVRKVRFSQLDRNGHMNNARYLDWVTDLLPAEFHREHPVKDLTVCYLNEAREGQSVRLNWQLTPEGILQVDGHTEENTRVFSVHLEL